MSLPRLDGQTYIPFRGSEKPTLGIELEFQIVDPETYALHAGSTKIIDAVGEHPRIKPELTQSTVEVITGICNNVGEARADLAGSMRTLYDIADAEGFTYAAAGTHPFSHWSEQKIFPTERYQQLVDRIQWAARRLTIYGMHVHVGVASGECAIVLGNMMTTYLPHLLALSASSPFSDAEDTGLDSVRTKIFEVMPTAGLPYRLANYSEFLRFMDSLMKSHAIQSIREIWWDIRPHPGFGTVELRVCDIPSTLTDTTSIAALAHSLIVYLDRFYQRGGTFDLLHPWIVRENKWRAARFGLDARIIVSNTGQERPLREELENLLDILTPVAKELQCLDELQGVRRLMSEGNSSARQRRVHQETGDLKAVVRHLVDELREDVTAPIDPRAEA